MNMKRNGRDDKLPAGRRKKPVQTSRGTLSKKRGTNSPTSEEDSDNLKFKKKPGGTRPPRPGATGSSRGTGRSGARPERADSRPGATRSPRGKSAGNSGRGPSKPAHSRQPGSSADGIRLNRYMASAGVASRRKADELIVAGAVTVNDEPVTELGIKIKPGDKVKFNGRLLKPERFVYVVLNKPKDYITTTSDPRERKTVMELVKKATGERIYPVGRLDRNTTGLLLLTNDGDLAEKLAHPRNRIPKIYYVTLHKSLKEEDMQKIKDGLILEDGPVTVDDVAYVEGGSKKEIGVELHSGRNRIVRRIFESLDYQIIKLDRVLYG
ncbi:MAG TPA: pseudouridine synthase, partial [Anseongella sp.]